MKKSVLSIAIVVFMLLTNLTFAQKMSDICGTHDQDALFNRMVANRELMEKGLLEDANRGAKKYIPVKVHLIAKSDGSGRLNEAKVYENLCQLNLDYADQEIVFYLKTEANGDVFNYINDNNAYNAQGNGLGLTTLKLAQNKFKNAINIFFAETTPSESQLGGVTLGYYSPINDWLVIRNDQVNKSSGTLSHELGHHFSLPHPFRGWDQQTCKDIYPTEWASGQPFQVTLITAPDGQTKVELADGSNCKTAGDGICDTPADYNFGFDWNGCSPFTKTIKDSKGNLLDPEEKLFMGYFIGCADYVFSKDQKAAILADYLSGSRAKIRPNYTPNIVTVDKFPALITPAANSVTSNYNSITFDWEDVPGADRYILEIDKTSSFSGLGVIRFFEKTSMKTVTNLAKNTNYYWRVTPTHSESGTCLSAAGAAKIKFKTSEFGVSTKEINNVSNWTVSPNPVNAGNSIFVDIEVAEPFMAEVSLVNNLGQKVQVIDNQPFTQGGNRVEVSTSNLPSGFYQVVLQTNKATISKKIVILN